jgi:hypothetical protein
LFFLYSAISRHSLDSFFILVQNQTSNRTGYSGKEAEASGNAGLDNLRKLRPPVQNCGEQSEDLKGVIAVAAKMLPDQLERHPKNIEAVMSGKRLRLWVFI